MNKENLFEFEKTLNWSYNIGSSQTLFKVKLTFDENNGSVTLHHVNDIIISESVPFHRTYELFKKHVPFMSYKDDGDIRDWILNIMYYFRNKI